MKGYDVQFRAKIGINANNIEEAEKQAERVLEEFKRIAPFPVFDIQLEILK